MSNEQERVNRLAPHVTRMARTLSYRYDLPADEVEQEMWVSILTHQTKYPLDKNLLVKACLDARQRLVRDGSPRRRTAKYLSPSLSLMSINEYAADDETCAVEECVGDATSPDVATTALQQAAADRAVRRSVVEAVRSLAGTQRAVAEMLMAGQRPAEIADRLGVKRPAVSYHIRQLRAALEPYRFLCAEM